ncbi:hypothetical protein T484DRAFT_1781196, partial [Baffinella frigidus]
QAPGATWLPGTARRPPPRLSATLALDSEDAAASVSLPPAVTLADFEEAVLAVDLAAPHAPLPAADPPLALSRDRQAPGGGGRIAWGASSSRRGGTGGRGAGGGGGGGGGGGRAFETGPGRGAMPLFQSGAFASSAWGMTGSLGGGREEGGASAGVPWKGVATALGVPWKGDTTAFSERSAVLDGGWRAHTVDYEVAVLGEEEGGAVERETEARIAWGRDDAHVRSGAGGAARTLWGLALARRVQEIPASLDALLRADSASLPWSVAARMPPFVPALPADPASPSPPQELAESDIWVEVKPSLTRNVFIP